MSCIETRILNYTRNSKENMAKEKKAFPYIFNSWRAILYTEKGKKAGVSDEWRDFKVFFKDVSPTYNQGLRLARKNKSEKFSSINFIWLSDDQLQIISGRSVLIELDGVSMTIKEWAALTGRTYNSIKNRYHKNIDYTDREIIYGRLSKPRRAIKDISDTDNVRAKVSKMCSSYRIKDFKKGLSYNLNIDWFLENIAYKNCIYCGDTKNIGCDRICNSIGHVISNVVPCCYTCNVVRNSLFSIEEMKLLGKTISKIKSNRLLEKSQ